MIVTEEPSAVARPAEAGSYLHSLPDDIVSTPDAGAVRSHLPHAGSLTASESTP
ncbi:hypothetical protein [Rhodococcus phenolicus]|uniref:hypothetical protein n=1 Tax=Rhodococcus phenolicus TaxID=263849 RepID=UPI000B045E22|nr:hypothetical protein [Rhodococcus phenolicus]